MTSLQARLWRNEKWSQEQLHRTTAPRGCGFLILARESRLLTSFKQLLA